MKLICMGDSLTKGYGVAIKDCWVSKLQENLADKMTIVNKGVAGDSSSSMLSRFTSDVTKQTPTHVLIMCGTNDALQGRNPRITFRNIKAMIDEARLNNIVPIIMSSPKILADVAMVRWDKTVDYAKANETIKATNTLLKSCAVSEDISFVDINSVIPQSGAYYTDGLHLDKLGHDLIFDKIMDVIN